MKLATDFVLEELQEIALAKAALEEQRRNVLQHCSHVSAAGIRTTNATDDGFSQCWVCHQEID
jgi:hypothetical protein